jgi:hypothetical protein
MTDEKCIDMINVKSATAEADKISFSNSISYFEEEVHETIYNQMSLTN